MADQDKVYEVKLNYFIEKKKKKSEIFFFLLPGGGLKRKQCLLVLGVYLF